MGVDGREEPRRSEESDDPPAPHKVPGQGGPFASASLDLWSDGPDPEVPQQRTPARSGLPALPAKAGREPSGSGTDADAGAGTDASSDVRAEIGAEIGADDADVPPSDLELVAQLRGSGEGGEAYEELYRRHADAVRRYARSCCRDEHTAEDLTNEVFTSTLQAVRGGSGPDSAVRAYLLTTVRRVAAAWARTAKREQLVEDFAVFATSAASSSVTADEDTLNLGADVRAMQEAEESLAVQAFRSLPERWQTVLWHTTVEEESPSDVGPLLGLSANATAVLAHRAREGLKQAYLQAHVNTQLMAGGDCAQYADRLGAYARGRLRTRAERGMRRHLEGCAKCRTAALEVADVNERLRALLPVAVIGWFAAGWSVKAVAGLAAGATAGAVGAGAAAGAAGAGAAVGAAGSVGAGSAGAGGAGGAASGAGAASAGAGSGGAGAGAASGAGASAGAGGGSVGGSGAGALVGEGLGLPVKVALGAGVLAATGAVIAYAVAGHSPAPPDRPQARATAAPVVPPPHKPGPRPSLTASPAPSAPPALVAKSAPKSSSPALSPSPSPSPSESASAGPSASASPSPPASPTPRPSPSLPKAKPSTPATPHRPTPVPPPPPSHVYALNELRYSGIGDGDGGAPEVRLGGSWLWQRYGLRVGGTTYRDGASVHAASSVTIELNRSCTSYDALAGVDDMTLGLGAVTFSVYADGERLWSSGLVRGGRPAVPVHAPLAGRRTLRLVVEPRSAADRVAVADWADARISCGSLRSPTASSAGDGSARAAAWWRHRPWRR
ncbi:sigma-70 family RNA polymerase sigma factor [Streptomyces triculaminicus]|uniref:sigma-70 family RNA polymerase sigma factor n=1 Tax=Streptomyces triculaminicus TaxID=2816232 RepID=UPI0037D10E61